MAIAPYSWKSTDELKQKNTMANAMQGQSPSPFGVTPTAQSQTQTPAARQMGSASLPAPAPSAGVSAFAMPKTMGDAMRAPMPSVDSNMGLAQKNIQEGFQPLAYNGPADDLARNELQKTLDANQRATLEQSALSGRGRTGQIGGDLVNYLSQSAIPQKMQLEGTLQANRLAQDTQRAQNAQGNLLNYAGLGSQERMQANQIASNEKLGFGDLSLREKQLSQAGEQFQSELEFKRYAADKGFSEAETQRAWQSKESSLERGSREGVAFAGLSLEEKRLAQSGAQFQSELAFKKYAADQGFTSEQAQRAWQSKENEAQRASTEKLGFADLSIREKQLAQNASQFKDELSFKKYATDAGFSDAEAQRVWQSKESGLERTSKEKLGFADLSLKERSLSQDASQFQSELEFKKYATDKGFSDSEAQRAWQATQNEKEITSREKLGFAELSVKEKQLVQDGSQFKSELEFKKYAADRGFTDAEAQRAWQSVENSKEITSREKVSFASLSQQEKEMALKASQFTDQLSWDKEAAKLGLDDKAAERIWQGSENQKERAARATESGLNRELQKYLGDKGLDMDEQKLAENIRQFDNKQDFDKWATQAGLDAQANELIWKSNEADVSRKWETGERLSTQEHQVNLSRVQSELEVHREDLKHALNIDSMEKQAAIDKTMAAAANDYQMARDEKGMSHEMAMEQFKTNNTARLEQLGYDHQTAMQATEIQAQGIEKAKDREMETLQAKAELAFKYKSLSDQTGLSQQEIAIKQQSVTDQMSLGLKQLGLDQQKIDNALKSSDFQERAGVLATMIELGADNPDVADRVSAGYLSLMKEKGLITEEQYTAGMAGIKQGQDERIAEENKPPEPEKPGEYKTDNSVRDMASGVQNFSKGNVLTGTKDFLSGATGLPFSVAKDTGTAIKKLFSW
jgi:hypothetical protein